MPFPYRNKPFLYPSRIDQEKEPTLFQTPSKKFKDETMPMEQSSQK